jgi:hypothetical protein
LFVNTTPGWSGFQALLEAMYFHNPILVRSNEILTSYFPNLKMVAYIFEERGPSLESMLIENLANSSRFEQMSDAAREAVDSSTWNNFTAKLMELFK